MTETERPVDSDDHRHRRRLSNLLDRLPARFKAATLWLLKPESRWARVPAGLMLILGGFLAILPVFGLWMLPLGIILIAEDIPVVRRRVIAVFDWLENRRPHWFSERDGN